MRFLLLLSIICCGLFAMTVPVSAGDLRDNAYFKALEGSWTGDGEFISPDKPPQALKNHIEASFAPDGDEFRIRGNLDLDGTPLEYEWIYTVHEIEGLYRAVWKNLAQPDSRLEYSVTIDPVNLVATLEPAVGASGGSIIRFGQRIEGDHYLVDLRITDSTGNTTLEGTVTFSRG